MSIGLEALADVWERCGQAEKRESEEGQHFLCEVGRLEQGDKWSLGDRGGREKGTRREMGTERSREGQREEGHTAGRTPCPPEAPRSHTQTRSYSCQSSSRVPAPTGVFNVLHPLQAPKPPVHSTAFSSVPSPPAPPRAS